jgi:hypothetical protein
LVDQVVSPARTIHVLDRLSVRPGRLDGVITILAGEYQPKMHQLGATLMASLSAPIVLSDQPTQLVLLWSIPNLQTFWRIRFGSVADDGLMDVWPRIDPDLVERTREILTSGTPDTEAAQPAH